MEQLEERIVPTLRGDIIAVMQAEMMPDSSHVEVPIHIDANDFTMRHDNILLGLHVTSGSELGMPVLLDNLDRPVPMEYQRTGTYESDTASITIANFRAGEYALQVPTNGNQSGTFEVHMYLVGDATADQNVDHDDARIYRTRGVLNSWHDSAEYVAEADANWDGRITSHDYLLWRKNDRVSSRLQSLPLDVAPTPFTEQLPDGTYVVSQVDVSLIGVTAPGATVRLEDGDDGQFDNGTFIADAQGTFSFPVTLIEDISVFQIRTQDSLGQQRTATVTIQLGEEEEAEPPTIAIDTPAAGTLVATDFIVQGSVVEGTSPVTDVTVWLDGAPLGTVPVASNGTFEYATNLGTVADGSRTFTFRANDQAGLFDELDLPFVLDATPPEVTVTDPTTAVTVNAPFLLQGTANDNLSTITSVNVTLNGNSLGNVAVDGNGIFQLTPDLTALAEGGHALTFRATDEAGNIGTTNFDFTWDLTPPAVTLELDPESDSPPLGDNTTSLSTVTLSGETEPFLVVTLTQTGATATADLTGQYRFDNVALAPGENSFDVQTSDPAGNIGTAQITITHDTCGFDDEIELWTTSEEGGSESNRGSVVYETGSAILREGDSFVVTLQRTFTVPGAASALVIEFADPQFDTSAEGVNDALEAALLDADGNPLVHTVTPNGDAFLNWTESQALELAAGVTADNGTVTVNLGGLAVGTEFTLMIRLLNNDGDTNSSVEIHCVEVEAGLGEPQGTSSVFPVGAAFTNPGIPNFAQLVDVTPSFQPIYGQTFYHEDRTVLVADAALHNVGTYLIDSPLLVGITNLSDPSVRVRDADGTTPNGIPYYDFSQWLDDATLTPGEISEARPLTFYNPNQTPFTYDLIVLANLNQAPQITTVPDIEALVGRSYTYDVNATDPDGDPLTYSLPSAPAGMQIDESTGVITWNPTANDLGTHSVTVQVDDGRGGSTHQRFSLVAIEAPPNRPPIILTTPVIDAFAGEHYTYDADATDADGDPLTYSIQTVKTRSIEIENPGFESVGLGEGGRGSISPGWDVSIPLELAYNPRYEETYLGLVPEGQNVLRLQTGFTWYVDQVLTESVAAETTYRLQFDVTRSRSDGSDGSVQLLAGGSILAADAALPAGRFTTRTIEYTVAADDPRVGQPLAIRLFPPRSREVFLDNFRMTATGFVDGAPEGATFDTDTGRLDWSPEGTDVGEEMIRLTVDDSRGGVSEQTFKLAVHPDRQNHAPQIVSEPITNAIADSTTVYFFGGGGGVAGLYGQQPNTRTPFPSYLSVESAELADLAVYHLTSDWTRPEGMQALLERGGNILFIGENTTFFGNANAVINNALGELGSSMRLTAPSFDSGSHLTTRAAGRIIDHPLTAGVEVIEYSAPSTIAGALPENQLIFGDDGEGPLFAYEQIGNGSIFLLSDSNVIGFLPNSDNDNDQLFLNILEASRQEIPPYEYQIEAIDPDGDSLTYELLDAPAGMTVDPQTGLIHWTVTHDALIFGDQVPVRVRVTDGFSNAEQEFEISFALPGRGRLEGVVFEDENGDGIRALTESAVANQTVFIDNNNNGRFDRGEWYAVTNESGEYVFEDLPDGAYLLRTETRSGWRVTEPGEEFYQVVLTDSAAIADLNFGSQFVGENDNRQPEFMTEPPVEGVVGNLYGYAARAEDADFDSLQYSLEAYPDGMTIRQSGDIFWYPTHDQLGTHDVLLRVRDGRGGVDLQSFQVTVTGNTAPAITSTPRLQTEAGLPYQDRVRAQDADGDVLSFRLDEAPAGMTIDAVTGVFDWPSPTLGTHAIVVAVDDGQGGVATQSYDLAVVPELVNEPPVIDSAPVVRAVIGQPYRYLVTASDPNSDPLQYFLDSAPSGMTISETGLVEWTPTSSQLGPQAVIVRVEDGRGGSDVQEYTITVATHLSNDPPAIISNPVASVIIGQDYIYNAQATDLDGDPLFWRFGAAPTGMSIDEETGVIRWTPTSEQIGQHAVEITVLDGQGGTAIQSFSVEVRGVNTPPLIRSTPPTEAFADQPYRYAVNAVDPEGQGLQYAIGGPPSMTVDPATGLIEWTPTAAEGGTHTIILVVTDGFAQARQTFDIEVTTEVVNSAPVITSTPPGLATIDQPYQYELSAFDADGDAFTIELIDAPAGMLLVDGNLLVWTPTAEQAGPHTVTVYATDIHGGVGGQRYTVTGAVNEAPAILSNPVESISAGARYRYDVRVHDPDGDAVSYTLASAPAGMTIDDLGRIQWSPQEAEIGVYTVEIVVADQRGGEDRQRFDLSVTTDETAPQILVSVSENPVNFGGVVEILVNAVDDVAVESILVTANDIPIVLDASGRATLPVPAPGLIILRGTATDRAGNVGEQIVELTVVDPTDADAPVLAIHSPEFGATVEGPIDVIGTVTDDRLLYYTLSVAPFEDGEFVEIARGEETITDGVLGRFDPSTLANDSYFLQLYAVDANGKESIEQVFISVAGELKVGNFKLSFNDLSIPVSGIPITVARTYDSLNAATSSDFGYGWRLEFSDTDLRSSVARTGGEDDLFYNPYYDGARVFVTLPGGQREGFTFRLTLAPGLAGALLGIYEGTFVPDADVTSTLTTDPVTLRVTEYGEAIDYSSGLPWNPASPLFGETFTLRTVDGTRYTIEGDTGDLQQITDRNGNSLTFAESGIVSSSGQSVTFERDPQGRITAVIDPAGNRVEYTYDADGNLSTVTDRSQNTTTFEYEQPSRPHFLTEIIDPLGRTGIRSEYDNQGRLINMIDADGETIELLHDPDNFIETVRNQLGHATTFEYDTRGNVLTEIDAEGGVTKRTYDIRNNMLSEIFIIGEDDATTTNPNDPPDQAIFFTYDLSGNVLTETDALGNITRSTYDRFGNVLTTTDPLGNTTTNVYDDRGNLLTITDAAGTETRFTYDSAGNPLSIELPGGNVQTFTYDLRGNVVARTDALGNVTTFTYDANGNQLSETRTQTTPSGTRTIRTETDYDSENRLRFSRLFEDGVLQWETETVYDAVGNRIEEIDALGRSTHFVYDDRGLLTETIYPDATPEDLSDNPRTRTEYDAAGQTIAEIDEAGRRTVFVYDKVGRLVETFYPDATPNDLADNPSTQTEYDEAGRVTAQIDELGNRTEFEYDAAGRQTIVRNALGHETTTTYDKAGRQSTVTGPLGHTTQFIYDDAGRPVQTILPDGSSTHSVFDEAGRLAQRIDQAGLATDYEYDALGRLTAVVLPEVDDPLTGTRVRPRTEYEYDELGNLLVQRDALGRETHFEYDGQGRRTATVLPLGQRSTTAYDVVGRVESTTDFNGDTITFDYDERDRLIAKHFPDGTSVQYTYTDTGLRDTIIDIRGLTQYQYDERDRLLSGTDPDEMVISYTYDDAGNRTSVTTPSGTTTYTFDVLNRPETVTDADSDLTRYFYDLESRLVRTEFANGTEELRSYDEGNRLQKIEHLDALDSVFASFDYELDEVGNRTAVTEHDGRRVEYDYDELYRLVAEKITDAGTSTPSRTLEYEYDLVGNRLSRDDSTDGFTAYEYDDNDRLLSETTAGVETDYTYDDNGNTLSKTSPLESVFYEWDFENRLVAADTNGDGVNDVIYQYDADGMRVSKTENGIETRFLLDKNRPYAQVLEEYTPGGIIKVSYVHGLDLISQNRHGDTGKSFYHVDGLGSTRALSDALGIITDRYIYDAYGRTIGQVGVTGNVYLFAGEQRDSAIGLDYLRARYLNPSVGRFASRDRFSGFTTEPATRHKYQYASNNVPNWIDPSGLMTVKQAWAASIAIVLSGTGALLGATAHLQPTEKWYPVELHGLQANSEVVWKGSIIVLTGGYGRFLEASGLRFEGKAVELRNRHTKRAIYEFPRDNTLTATVDFIGFGFGVSITAATANLGTVELAAPAIFEPKAALSGRGSISSASATIGAVGPSKTSIRLGQATGKASTVALLFDAGVAFVGGISYVVKFSYMRE